MVSHEIGDKSDKSTSSATRASHPERKWMFTAEGRTGPGIERKPTGAGDSSLKDTGGSQDKTLQASDSRTTAKTGDKPGLSQSPETGNKPDLRSLTRVVKAALSQPPAETGNKLDYQYLARDVHDWIKSFKESFSIATEKEAKIHNFAARIYNFAVSKLGPSTDLSLIMPIKLGLRGGSEVTDNTDLISDEPQRWLNALNTLETDFRTNALNRAMRLGMDLREHDAPQTAITYADTLVAHLGQLRYDQYENGSWGERRRIIRDNIKSIAAAVATSTSRDVKNDVLRFLHGLGLAQVFSL